ncbi:J domain-containing protein [Paeniglutamicibacter sp. ZC-3]|uniref:J domain-containing protein n=1 Tax=Paeniglutamicibacter sp. ZC-3 TaxID=2986919 RepID=UPI0035581E9A
MFSAPLLPGRAAREQRLSPVGTRTGPGIAGARSDETKVRHTVSGFPDYYSVLGLDPHASPGDIARAYRSQLRHHHPDTRHPPASVEDAGRHGVLLQRAMEAHAVLADPIRRARYDREHLVPPPIAQPSATGFPRVSTPGSRSGGGEYLGVSPLRWDPPTRRRI